MEISDVRKRVRQAIDHARQRSAERRTQNDEATRAFGPLLDQIAVPIFRQVAQVLRADGHLFTVFTPSGSVRLMSDRNAEDFIELFLDTTGDAPLVLGRTSRSRGSRVHDAEQILGAPDRLTEEDVLAFVTKSLEPLVER